MALSIFVIFCIPNSPTVLISSEVMKSSSWVLLFFICFIYYLPTSAFSFGGPSQLLLLIYSSFAISTNEFTFHVPITNNLRYDLATVAGLDGLVAQVAHVGPNRTRQFLKSL